MMKLVLRLLGEKALETRNRFSLPRGRALASALAGRKHKHVRKTRPSPCLCFQFPKVPDGWNPAGSPLVREEGGVHNSVLRHKESIEQGLRADSS